MTQLTEYLYNLGKQMTIQEKYKTLLLIYFNDNFVFMFNNCFHTGASG